MNDVSRLLMDIQIAISLEFAVRPYNDVVVYMTDKCRELIIKDIVCVLDETRKPPIYDTIFGCVTRRMVADGIRFAVARERVYERSKTDE